MAERLCFLTIREVVRRTTLSKTELYRRIHAGTFPRAVRVAPYRVAFVEAEVTAWLAERVAERDASAARSAAD